MDEPSEKITKFLIFFVIFVLIIKSASQGGFFEPKDHKGTGYYVLIPTGWQKAKKQKDVYYPRDVDVVMFVPQGTDISAGMPDMHISIYAKKLSTPIWIEDEFPDILNSIRQEGMDIKDQGEIKIDDVISNWVVYFDKAAPALVLEFYIVTDSSMFYKMQYSAPPEKFNKYRKSFEELKDSFKFRFSII